MSVTKLVIVEVDGCCDQVALVVTVNPKSSYVVSFSSLSEDELDTPMEMVYDKYVSEAVSQYGAAEEFKFNHTHLRAFNPDLVMEDIDPFIMLSGYVNTLAA
ncbi:hypothetical protein VCHA53O466_140156 [Vibrio chagasii]|nr:hypothetical protein VCHA53O466_140156 [Vibrio chagasii]